MSTSPSHAASGTLSSGGYEGLLSAAEVKAAAAEVSQDEASRLLRAARKEHVAMLMQDVEKRGAMKPRSAHSASRRLQAATPVAGEGRTMTPGSAAHQTPSHDSSGAGGSSESALFRSRQLGAPGPRRRFEREQLPLTSPDLPADLAQDADVEGVLDALQPQLSAPLVQAGMGLLLHMLEALRRLHAPDSECLAALSPSEGEGLLQRLTPPKVKVAAERAAWASTLQLLQETLARGASFPTLGQPPLHALSSAELVQALDAAAWAWRRVVRCEWRLRVWSVLRRRTGLVRRFFWWAFVCEQISVRTAVAVARAREASGRDYGMLDWQAALEHTLGAFVSPGEGGAPPGPAQLFATLSSQYTAAFLATTQISTDITVTGGGRLATGLAVSGGAHRNSSTISTASGLRDDTFHALRALLVESAMGMFTRAFAGSPSLGVGGPLHPPALRVRVAGLLDQLTGQEGNHSNLALAPPPSHDQLALRPWRSSQQQRFNDVLARWQVSEGAVQAKQRLAAAGAAGAAEDVAHETEALLQRASNAWAVDPAGSAGAEARSALLASATAALADPVGQPLTVGGRPVSSVALRRVLASTNVAARMALIMPSARSHISTGHIGGQSGPEAGDAPSGDEEGDDGASTVSWSTVDTETELQLGSPRKVQATKRRKALEAQAEAAAALEATAATQVHALEPAVTHGGVHGHSLAPHLEGAGAEDDAQQVQRRRRVPLARRKVAPKAWPPPLAEAVLEEEQRLRFSQRHKAQPRQPVVLMPHGQRTRLGASPMLRQHLAQGGGGAGHSRAQQRAARTASGAAHRAAVTTPLMRMVPVAAWSPPTPRTMEGLFQAARGLPPDQVMRSLLNPDPAGVQGVVSASDQVVSSGTVSLRHDARAATPGAAPHPLFLPTAMPRAKTAPAGSHGRSADLARWWGHQPPSVDGQGPAEDSKASRFAQQAAAAAEWGLQHPFSFPAATTEAALMFGVASAGGLGGAVLQAVALAGQEEQGAETAPPATPAMRERPKRKSGPSPQTPPEDDPQPDAKAFVADTAPQAPSAVLGLAPVASDGWLPGVPVRGKGAPLMVGGAAQGTPTAPDTALSEDRTSATEQDIVASGQTVSQPPERPASSDAGDFFLTAVAEAEPRAEEDAPRAGAALLPASVPTLHSPVRNAVWRNISNKARLSVAKQQALAARLMEGGGDKPGMRVEGQGPALGYALAASSLASTRQARQSNQALGSSAAARVITANRPDIVGRPLLPGEHTVGMSAALAAAPSTGDKAQLLRSVALKRHADLKAKVRAFTTTARVSRAQVRRELRDMRRLHRALSRSKHAQTLVRQLVAMRAADFEAISAKASAGGAADVPGAHSRSRAAQRRARQAAQAGQWSGSTPLGRQAREAAVAAAHRHAKPEVDKAEAHAAFIAMLSQLRREVATAEGGVREEELQDAALLRALVKAAAAQRPEAASPATSFPSGRRGEVRMLSEALVLEAWQAQEEGEVEEQKKGGDVEDAAVGETLVPPTSWQAAGDGSAFSRGIFQKGDKAKDAAGDKYGTMRVVEEGDETIEAPGQQVRGPLLSLLGYDHTHRRGRLEEPDAVAGAIAARAATYAQQQAAAPVDSQGATASPAPRTPTRASTSPTATDVGLDTEAASAIERTLSGQSRASDHKGFRGLGKPPGASGNPRAGMSDFDKRVDRALDPHAAHCVSPVAAAVAALEHRDVLQDLLRPFPGQGWTQDDLHTFTGSRAGRSGLAGFAAQSGVAAQLQSMRGGSAHSQRSGTSAEASVLGVSPDELQRAAQVKGHALDTEQDYLDRVGRLALRVHELHRREVEEAAEAKAKVAAQRGRRARKRTERSRARQLATSTSLPALPSSTTGQKQPASSPLARATSHATRMQVGASKLAYSTRRSERLDSAGDSDGGVAAELSFASDSDDSLEEWEARRVKEHAQPVRRLQRAARHQKRRAIESNPAIMSAVRSQKRQAALRDARLQSMRQRHARSAQLTASALESTDLVREEVMTSKEVTKRVRLAAKGSVLPRHLQPLGPKSVRGGAAAYGAKPPQQPLHNAASDAVEAQASKLDVSDVGRITLAVNRRRMTDHLRRVQRQQALQAIEWASSQQQAEQQRWGGGSGKWEKVLSASEAAQSAHGAAQVSGTGTRLSTLADEVEGVVSLATDHLGAVASQAARMQHHAQAHGAAPLPVAHALPPAVLVGRPDEHAGAGAASQLAKLKLRAATRRASVTESSGVKP